MKLLILTQYFPPEIGAPQTRLQSLAAELTRLGHEIEVVTGFPNYPRGKFFPGYGGSLYRREVVSTVVIHRVWLLPAMGGGFRRMLNYASFTLMACLGLFMAKKPDYIFVESPPLFLSIPAYFAGLIWGVPSIFNVADLWPDAIVDGGFLKDGRLMRLLFAIERWSYRKAAYVNAVTEGIRHALLTKKGVPQEKILFLPNGVDTNLFRPQDSDQNLKRELGLPGKKVILWAGTLGYSHGLENVLRAAKLLDGQPEIHFLFVGDGSARTALEQMRTTLELSNVTFCDPVPVERLVTYFSIAECCLASLTASAVNLGARPSKIFPAMASGKALIFIGSGEGAKLVQEAGAGVVVQSGDAQAIADAVLQLIKNPTLVRKLGTNGRSLVEKNFQWQALIDRWVSQLDQPQFSGNPISDPAGVSKSSAPIED
jgi:colanic acid biosynthesis glycosyl transferase WcaI